MLFLSLSSRRLAFVALVIAALGLLAFGVAGVGRGSSVHFADLRYFYLAGLLTAQGLSPYDVAAFKAASLQHGLGAAIDLFPYPPHSLALCVLLSWLLIDARGDGCRKSLAVDEPSLPLGPQRNHDHEVIEFVVAVSRHVALRIAADHQLAPTLRRRPSDARVLHEDVQRIDDLIEPRFDVLHFMRQHVLGNARDVRRQLRRQLQACHARLAASLRAASARTLGVGGFLPAANPLA